MNYHPDFIWTALKMLVVLSILLSVLVLGLYVAKRMFKGRDNQPGRRMMRVLANTYVGVKKNVSLVEVPGAILVLGVTSDTISLLAKIEDDEVLKKFRDSEDETITGLFSNQLRKFSARYKTMDARENSSGNGPDHRISEKRGE